MKVFLSWSGKKSSALAVELKTWLSCIFQSIEFWMSETDIEAGSRWNNSISEALESTEFGIICITKENINSPWILFEAGAISKSIANGKLIPLLIDVEKSDLQGNPLSFFQAVSPTKEELFKMVKTLSDSSPIDHRDYKTLESVFEKWYPDIEKKILRINQTVYSMNSSKMPIVLSTQELTVLQLYASGKSTHEIATELHKSPPSINTHLRNMRSKMDVKSLTDVVIIAMQNGLIEP